MFRPITILTSLMLSGSVMAFSTTDLFPNEQVVVGVSAGPTWLFGNKNQTINLQPDVVKTYTGGNDTNVFPTGEIFLGLQKPFNASSLNQSFVGQLGISFAGAGYGRVNGNIWDDGDPAFNNSDYTYKVNHMLLAIKGRLIADCNYFFKPYVSASLGVGFNRAYDFSINTKINQEVAAPPFSSNTNTTFSYTLGVGLQTTITPHLQAAIGYEFADWGKTQLGRAQGQTVGNGLSLNHLYANQLQLSLFYID